MSSTENSDTKLKKWRTQLSRGVLEFIVLLLLRKERHGWEILQLARSLLPPSDSQLGDGTIYNILTRLKEESMVTTRNEVYEGRMRRYYKLSQKGLEQIDLMVTDWENLLASINEAREFSIE